MNFKKYHESRNLLNNTATDTESNGVRITINPDKSITINGRMTSGTATYFNISSVKFTSEKKYTISGVTGYTDETLQIFTESSTAFSVGNRLQTYNGAITRTARGNETCTIRLYVYSGVTYENVRVYPFICEGSTPQPYEPYSSEVWHDTPHYIHKIDTDTLTTLPADIYANDTTATVGLKGNMEQSGTPTPSSPITPSECGERTAQLIPEIVQGGVSTSNGSFSQSSNRVRTKYIPVESGKTYTVSSGNLYLATGCYYNNGVFSSSIDEVVATTTSATFTVPENVNQIAIGFRTVNGTTNITPSDLQNYMLNEGSTAQPYEPYWT